MSNTNCLEGMECPKCKQADRLFIYAYVRADVTDEGVENADGTYEWTAESPCCCPVCDHSATVNEFTAEERGPE